MHRGQVYYRQADNWLNLEGVILEDDGTKWSPVADQTQDPDLVETGGWARHGDYLGPSVFNELKAFLGVLKAARRVRRWPSGSRGARKLVKGANSAYTRAFH